MPRADAAQPALRVRTDVLKLAEAQREIERHSLRFSDIARVTSVGSLETSHGGRLVFSNARASELQGMPADTCMSAPQPASLRPTNR